MDLIYAAGVNLEVPADYCMGGEPCPLSSVDPRRQIHRVDACQALHKACGGGAELCPDPTTLPRCASRAPYTGLNPELTDAQLSVFAGTDYDASGISYELTGLAVCDQPAIFTDSPSYPEVPCPERQYYGAETVPWNLPQPGSNPCPLCVFAVDGTKGTLYLEIADSYSSSLFNTTLNIGGVGNVYLGGFGPLTAGTKLIISGIQVPSPAIYWSSVSFLTPTTSGIASTTSYLLTVHK
jgi:hypothetical protein